MTMLGFDEMLPAPGQGALALQCRRSANPILDLLAPINHEPSRLAVITERAVVQALNGDCHSPIAALATVTADQLHLQVAVGARDGNPPLLTAKAAAPLSNAPDAVASILQALTAQGVTKILAAP